MSQEIGQLLSKIPIFSSLDSSSLHEIMPFFKQKEYSSGDVLFREDSPGDKLYIVVAGEIAIFKSTKNGKEATLAVRKEGDAIGEMSLFNDQRRFASARAVRQTTVLELSKSDFKRIVYEHPQVAYHVIGVLSSRIKESDLHVMHELKNKREQLDEAYRNIEAAAEALKGFKRELGV